MMGTPLQEMDAQALVRMILSVGTALSLPLRLVMTTIILQMTAAFNALVNLAILA